MTERVNNMETKKECTEKLVASYKEQIKDLKDEIKALRELLDCAAANISILVEKKGGSCTISKKSVSEALGKYRLHAYADGAGNYVLNLVEDKK